MNKIVSAIIVIASLLFVTMIFVTTIKDLVNSYNYSKYAEKAHREFGVSTKEFDKYVEFAKRLCGVKHLYRNAYLIAEEEWYDENYK